ncbi:universal stress protein [Streptomyces sp. NPDC059442]|uniref:universal stress protein n=1 Tax=unclassified Streptomyces TaxID=2593676 RepID=UPI0036A4C243
MTAHVTVGLDGTEESFAAARWAAREAVLREVALHVLHVDEWPAAPELPDSYVHAVAERADKLLQKAVNQAQEDHPGLEVVAERVAGRTADVLTAAANEADLTVLDSRRLGGVSGFVVGSVSLAVVGSARHPVVLLRADRAAGRPMAARGGIVVGVDVYRPCEALLAFSFGEAARRGVPLRFLHSWTLPASYGYAAIMDPPAGEELGERMMDNLDELVDPWRKRYRGVEVTAKAVVGSAAYQLVEASRTADLVVIGRRSRRMPLVPHLGHVAHAVIHHSPAPVAVVPLPASRTRR